MERVQDAGNGIEIFENDIVLYLDQFCAEQKIEDLKTESQSVWNGCLMYIARHLFKDRSKLKQRNNIPCQNADAPITNFNSYDYELVNNICDYYIYLCSIYDKEVSIMGFSNLTNIDYGVIMEWGNNYTGSNRLGSLSSEIYKKLLVKREESLSNKLATGNKNPVGILAILNRHYQWNLPGVSREKANNNTLTASELPRLEAAEVSVTDGKTHYLTASDDGKTE